MAIKERRVTYAIPENYMDESRIVHGMFRTRNFLEGATMAILAGLIVFFFVPASGPEVKAIQLTAVCGMLFLLGNSGFNGDALSTTIINAYKWSKSHGIMLYNFNARPLIKSPLQAHLEKELPRDKIADMVDNLRDWQKEKQENVRLVEGETFEFVEDKDLEEIRADNYEFVDGYVDENGKFIELPPNALEELAPVKIPEPAEQKTTFTTVEKKEPKKTSAEPELDLDSIFGEEE